MSFKDIATPFIDYGIKVFPLQTGEKMPPAGLDFLSEATTSHRAVAKWDRENPDYNVALLADENFCFLEFDIKGGMTAASQEMGISECPNTLIQLSGGGFGHFIFQHTERSREIGNRSRNLDTACTCNKQESRPCGCKEGGVHHHHEWFSFRAHNKYLVGAGSLHPNGNYYKEHNKAEPIPVPEWICDFVEKYTAGKPTSSGNGNVSEDFDFDELMEFFEISGYQSGNWFVTDVCPVAGYKHQNSKRTGFYWDGESLGWSCFAQGCDGSSMTVGQLVGYLNKLKGEPYKGVIWDTDDEDDDDNGFEVEDSDSLDFKPAQISTPAKATLEVEQVLDILNEPSPLTYRDPLADMSEETRQSLHESAVKAKEAMAKAKTDSAKEIAQETEDESEQEDEATQSNKSDPAWKVVAQQGDMMMVCKRASDFVMTELEWLWPEKIPQGKMAFFTGKPDSGKTMATLDVVARVTTGADWPDGSKNEHGAGEVILASSEDDPNDTLIPRLAAAGADLSKVQIMVGTVIRTKEKKKMNVLNLKRDAKMLLQVIKDNPAVKLLVLDPVVSFFGDADSNRDKDIRPIMDALKRTCEQSKLTIIGIVHSNKRSDVDAMDKVSGARALGASVRAVWGFSKDPDDDKKWHMANVKGNLAKEKHGLDYIIEDTPVTLGNGKVIRVPHVVWGDKFEGNADDLLAASREKRDTGNFKVTLAKAYLKTAVKYPVKASKLYEQAQQAEGLTSDNLKRAKAKLTGEGFVITSRKEIDGWYWHHQVDGQSVESESAKEVTIDDVEP